jgi:hypothetical protein
MRWPGPKLGYGATKKKSVSQVPQSAANFFTSWSVVNFARRTFLHGVGYCVHVTLSDLCLSNLT